MSRPAKEARGFIPGNYARSSRCLFMGDFDSKKNNDLWTRFTQVYDYSDIGTIQVPHHGAKDNWRVEMKDIKQHDFIISAGSTNTYHHPDYWVTVDIMENRPQNSLSVVSEKKQTEKEQSFIVY